MKRLALPFITVAALLCSAAISMAGGVSPASDTDSTGVSLIAVGGFLTWAAIALFIMVIVPRRSAVIAALSLIAILVGTSFAFAQQTTTPSALDGLLDAARPLLNDIVNTLMATALAALAWYLKTKWGIELEMNRRDAFQIATTNAAGLYKSTGDMPRAVEYLKEAAPDAIKAFDIPEQTLPEKIQAKTGIIEVAGGVAPVMPGAVEAATARRT